MELCDIRDEFGTKTGRIIERGQPMEDDEYVLGVFVLIRDREGKYLIQKRSMNKTEFAGRWDLTGGAVISGEESGIAAIREVQEEVGLDLDPDRMVLIGRLQMKNRLVDIWLTEIDFKIEDCTACDKEVEELALVTSNIMIERIFDENRIEEDYRKMIRLAVNQDI
ncbi:MAG TPA: NUDIX domain-containing protein [Mobilitalea sp.]|nr:NUDIX domain-containing protein [Mobilitalea sp.]